MNSTTLPPIGCNGRGAQASGLAAPVSLAEAVQLAPIRVVGILCRRKLSLQALRALGPGSLIPLPQNVLDDARLETGNRQLLARGRLGEADGFHAIRLRHAEAPLQGATTAAAPEPAFDIASGMPFAAPRNLSAGTPPVLADLEPPLADIDTPDAFRDAQALDASRARGNSRA